MTKNLFMLCDEESINYKGFNLGSLVSESVEKSGYRATQINIADNELKPCMGCFNCWIKTPGLCVNTHDRANDISRHMVNSDIMILITHSVYGGYSYGIKSFLDRFIPSISPFFEMINGEMHHQKRYTDFPDFIAFGFGEMSLLERNTFEQLIRRNAINFHAKRNLALTAESDTEITWAISKLSSFISGTNHA